MKTFLTLSLNVLLPALLVAQTSPANRSLVLRPFDFEEAAQRRHRKSKAKGKSDAVRQAVAEAAVAQKIFVERRNRPPARRRATTSGCSRLP